MATEDRPRAEAPRPALRELLKRRRAELGLSYVKLAQRCVDPETGDRVVKDSWLHRLETGETVIAPDFRMLVGLAAGLEVALEVVQAAAGEQFFGISTVKGESGQARALLARADRMTPEQVDALARFLDVIAPQE
ncbi:helix-turn-helix transcriptional regulator [Streptomyces sp. NPDC047971]|uniref:helix-turn-helix domain-containing protein n=1 Tax=Streptomyces sp. NPDC047971 TaxID=3154499 RepID=UPI0033D6F8D1